MLYHFQTFDKGTRTEDMMGMKLGQKITGSLYGAGDKLRKERNKQSIRHKALFRLDGASPHIHYVSYCLKSIERNTYREQDVKFRNGYSQPKPAHQPYDFTTEESEIFISEENGEIYGENPGEHSFSFAGPG